MSARQWWGSCENDNCAITVTIELSMDSPAQTLDNPRQWEGAPFFECPVCGSTFEWGGSEPDTSWDKEQRTPPGNRPTQTLPHEQHATEAPRQTANIIEGPSEVRPSAIPAREDAVEAIEKTLREHRYVSWIEGPHTCSAAHCEWTGYDWQRHVADVAATTIAHLVPTALHDTIENQRLKHLNGFLNRQSIEASEVGLKVVKQRDDALRKLAAMDALIELHHSRDPAHPTISVAELASILRYQP